MRPVPRLRPPPARPAAPPPPKKGSKRAARAPAALNVADYIQSTTVMAPEALKIDSTVTHGQVLRAPTPCARPLVPLNLSRARIAGPGDPV